VGLEGREGLSATADEGWSPILAETGAGLLAPTHVESWRKGRIDFLERVIQVNLKKISLSMAMFRHWALANGLKPSIEQPQQPKIPSSGLTWMRRGLLLFSDDGPPAFQPRSRARVSDLRPRISLKAKSQVQLCVPSKANGMRFEGECRANGSRVGEHTALGVGKGRHFRAFSVIPTRSQHASK
jgi:hypothetical protein